VPAEGEAVFYLGDDRELRCAIAFVVGLMPEGTAECGLETPEILPRLGRETQLLRHREEAFHLELFVGDDLVEFVPEFLHVWNGRHRYAAIESPANRISKNSP